MDLLIFGILLGMGAAIPIGPVNLEIIRRNLRFGTPYGIAMGLGACGADVVYLILLCAGALTLLQYPDVMRIISLLGSIVLAWFAIKIFRSSPKDQVEKNIQPSLWKYGFDGFTITMINPMTILFWASVSSQITLATANQDNAIVLAGLGVIIGTVGWVLIMNYILHVTRERLSNKIIHRLNHIGGVILLSFAGFGFYNVILG